MATASEKANQADLLGQGGTFGAQPTNIRPRATTADGLFYVDTGQPTPLYIRRQQQMQGLISSSDYKDTTFNPGSGGDYQYDAQKGQYYSIGANGKKIYITNDPAKEFDAQQTPIFTANKLPPGKANYTNALLGAGGGAAAGAVGGVPGAVVGGLVGGLTGLPQAQGQGLYLTQGSGEVPGRQGTAAEAALGNATYQATGRSTPVGGFAPTANPFAPTSQPQMPTYTPGMGTNGGSALSAEAQKVISNANAMAAQSQQRADSFYTQAASAGTRAAPQITAPSSANQQAVYDRAMNFNAQSGAAAIRAERADISGANRLEGYQLDQQGINNLEGFQSTNSQGGVANLENFQSTNSAQGVGRLNAYDPTDTTNSAKQLDAFQARNTQQGADAVLGFNPGQVQQDAASLRNFQADRSGIDRLNAYADEAQGPSAAQAMLRSQADADKRTQLAIARSGRGTPAGAVQAQRQAMTEGGLIEAETRGQGAALAAQEFEAYKGRQLQALAQAGAQISAAEGQRLQALSQAGVLMSQADQQKLSALQAYGQLKATQDSQLLSAKQSAGQLNANADNMRLGAISNAASVQSQMDAQRLGAISNAASLRGQMDQQQLSAIGQAAQLRTQGDVIQSNNLQAAGQMRLAGSEINQRGAIAASQADLQAQALNLQSLSLAGNISTEIRNQDINVLRSNLDASLQTMGLNDQQVRFFSQLGSDREVASQNLQQQAGALGINVAQAQQALELQWAQFGLSQLSQQQQVQYQQQVLQQNATQFNTSSAQQQQQIAMQGQNQNFNQQQTNRNNTLQTLGSIFQGASLLFGSSNSPPANNAASSTGPTGGYQTNLAGQNTAPPIGYNSSGQVYDPFTGTWKNPSA